MESRGKDKRAQLFAIALCGLLAGVVIAAAAFPAVAVTGLTAKSASDEFENLPSDLATPPLPQTSYLLAADGSPITSFYAENRVPVPISEVPQMMQDAMVAAEDARFYQHNGVDMQGIIRAFVRNQQAGDIQQGASTLTQQYVRNVLSYAADTPAERRLATEDTVGRKVREARYAVALEKQLTKQQILERYLNISFYGNGGYGLGSAAQRYFSKAPKDLTLAEAAMLAGMVRSPSTYDPISGDADAARARRNYVLSRMADLGYITRVEANEAAATKLELHPRKPQGSCVNGDPSYGFYCDWFLDWWKSNPAFGRNRTEREQNLKTGGYKIVTALDPATQRAAQKAVDEEVRRTSNFATGVVVVQPGTGRVTAMAINRTYSLKKNPAGGSAPNTVNPLLTGTNVSPGYQAGSTFKLFTLAAAIEKGLPLGTKIYSAGRIKTQFRNASGPVACDGDYWCPKNASGRMSGTHTMWSGFGESVNTFFVQLEERIGVKAAVNMAERLGVTFRSSKDYDQRNAVQTNPKAWGSFTLGTALVTPLDMATAYATIAARGKRCDPTPLLSLADRNGRQIAFGNPTCKQVLAPDIADAVADAARCPVGDDAASGCSRRNGVTAGRVGGAFVRPIAGKTGTTDDNKAAWFVGFTPNLAAAVFYSDPDNPNVRPVPNYRVPATVFIKTMQTALSTVAPKGFVAPTSFRKWGADGSPPTLKSDPSVGGGPADPDQERRERDRRSPTPRPGEDDEDPDEEDGGRTTTPPTPGD
ncbi:transglycosylase domain-containing protein [Cryptosporangium aurantiacum]|uniref:Membrane carboxypeptidase (Penicillin-binding protein) n=1 Tax=Cryptosporangium aurantiacum TaxID=134849 RepID=A0A1M7RNX5_9ACTN|nr:transglycosylase domain-containing protein [Cryptosporangium aurantiacum]SHN48013.1 Membrane carboxypeptidase (penicillin-binding protein) [Cryptosporangium aurantiacum]